MGFDVGKENYILFGMITSAVILPFTCKVAKDYDTLVSSYLDVINLMSLRM